MSEGTIRVLVVEDSPDDLEMILDSLGGRSSPAFEVESASSAEEGGRALGNVSPDVLLLDMRLPDSDGIATVETFLEKTSVPVVVLTGTDDEKVAVKAVQMGAQDYLVKATITPALIGRAIRHAIERQRLRLELSAARSGHRDAELSAALRPGPGNGPPAAHASLRESVPEEFETLTRRFSDLLDQAEEQRIYKVEHDFSLELRDMAAHLARFRAAPGDVTDIHSAALKKKSVSVNWHRYSIYLEEARLLTLELMGHLAGRYRLDCLDLERPGDSN